jgi:hypothetical protein
MKNKHFVLDTNCLISALIISTSVNRLALEKADKNGSLIFSRETLTELTQTLIRSKFDKYVSLGERLEYIQRLERRGKIFDVKSDFTVCRDKKDNKFLNLAYDSEAVCIITGDNDLLVLNPFENIPILSAATFLNSFRLA